MKGSAPLAGVVVLDYAQYVAGPFCGMLLADLGADVIKVEPPFGDQWRRQEPCGADFSYPFIGLNRNKRSITLDLKTAEGRRMSRELVAEADIVVHNTPGSRLRAFELDAESLLAANPRLAVVRITAFGSHGPAGERTGYDLSAQSASGLLMADAREGDDVPIRAGGIAMTDFSAGMLAAVAALGALTRARAIGQGGEVEVSLLGAGVALQAQRFVADASADGAGDHRPRAAQPEDLQATARKAALGLRVNGYYRAYRTAEGFITVACLNVHQRKALLATFGLEDAAVEDPDAMPSSPAEMQRRERVVQQLERALLTRPAREWAPYLRDLGVPCEEVRTLEDLFDDPQLKANGLVQELDQPGLGRLKVLGNVFKVDGQAPPAQLPAPARGEHAEEVLGAQGTISTVEKR